MMMKPFRTCPSLALILVLLAVSGLALADGSSETSAGKVEKSSAAPAQPGKASSPPARQASKAKPGADPVLAEILQLREQQGSLLQGTIFGEYEIDEQAAEDFRRLIGEIFEQCPRPVSKRLVDRPRPTPPRVGWQPPSALDDALVESLRSTSQLLDQKSHELERQREFGEADAVRELAQQLRLKARNLDGWSPVLPNTRAAVAPAPTVSY